MNMTVIERQKEKNYKLTILGNQEDGRSFESDKLSWKVMLGYK